MVGESSGVGRAVVIVGESSAAVERAGVMVVESSGVGRAVVMVVVKGRARVIAVEVADSSVEITSCVLW